MDEQLTIITEYHISTAIKKEILIWENDMSTRKFSDSEKQEVSEIIHDYLSWAVDVNLLITPPQLPVVIKRMIRKGWCIV